MIGKGEGRKRVVWFVSGVIFSKSSENQAVVFCPGIQGIKNECNVGEKFA